MRRLRGMWISNQEPVELDDIIYSLEHKMLDRGVKVTVIKFILYCLF